MLPSSIMRQKISISIDTETLSKVDEGIIDKKFRNRSHAFEYALIKILNEEVKNE